MQCPYCRNIEQGQWLYAHGPPNQDFDEHDFDLSPDLVIDLHHIFSLKYNIHGFGTDVILT